MFDWFFARNCYSLSKFILLCCPHPPQTHRNEYLTTLRSKIYSYLSTRLDRPWWFQEVEAPDFKKTGTWRWYSTEQNPSWEACCFSPIHEYRSILFNPKVHNHIHKRPPPVPILGQISSVHASPSHIVKIHFNIIPLSIPRSTKCCLSLRSIHQILQTPLLSTVRATRLAQFCKYVKYKCMSELPCFCASANYWSVELL